MPKILELTKKDKQNVIRKVGSIEIKNQTENSADLCFFGDINSESWGEWKKYFPEDQAPADVQEFLSGLENVSKLNVHINSGGGSVFGGIAIHNMLERYDAEITVYVEGIAASIASVIAMAGDHIIVPENAQVMIHKPSSFTRGNADDMRKEADVLDSCQKTILSTYMKHVKEGVTEDQINELIDNETWLNGKEWQQYFDFELSDSGSNAAAAASDYYDDYKNLPQNLEDRSLGTAGDLNIDLIADKVAEKIAKTITDQIVPKDDLEKKDHKEDSDKEKEKLLAELDLI